MTTPAVGDRTDQRCAFAAERRGDPMSGTAAPARGMLLVEQPGPWGRQALVQSRLDRDVGAALGARANAAALRVLLIRRPGRREQAAVGTPRRWALVDSRPGHEVTRWGRFVDDADLLGLPLDGSAGAPSYEPFYLVCTHGRHDACCAIRGRPVAAALARSRPGAVWECSHLGGDRFAANLVVLPHGLYYGRVSPQTAPQVAAAHERGEVVVPLLRGRTVFSPVVQAAQQHARLTLGRLAVEALPPRRTEPLGQGRWRVTLADGPDQLVLDVTSVVAGEAALLTCAATHPAHPPGFLVSPAAGAGSRT